MPTDKPAAKKPMAKRDDLNTSVDPWFEKLPDVQKPTATELRSLIEATLPGVPSGLKWGNPFWTINGDIVVGIRSAKAHLGLILPGTGAELADPKGLLEGDSKTGRHLKIPNGSALPTADIVGWIQGAAARIRS